MRAGPSRSVSRRALNMVNDDHVDRGGDRLEAQTKLLLNRREDRRTPIHGFRCRTERIRIPRHADIEGSIESGSIDDVAALSG